MEEFKDISVNFIVQYKRKGIFKYLEKLGWIKMKRVGYEFLVREDGRVDVFSSDNPEFCTLNTILVRGLPES